MSETYATLQDAEVQDAVQLNDPTVQAILEGPDIWFFWMKRDMPSVVGTKHFREYKDTGVSPRTMYMWYRLVITASQWAQLQDHPEKGRLIMLNAVKTDSAEVVQFGALFDEYSIYVPTADQVLAFLPEGFEDWDVVLCTLMELQEYTYMDQKLMEPPKFGRELLVSGKI